VSWKGIRIAPEPTPCYGCTDRTATCHGTCKRYAIFHAACEAIRHKRKLRREVNEAIDDAMKRNPGKREL
jgi:hypothetical protein